MQHFQSKSLKGRMGQNSVQIHAPEMSKQKQDAFKQPTHADFLYTSMAKKFMFFNEVPH